MQPQPRDGLACGPGIEQANLNVPALLKIQANWPFAPGFAVTMFGMSCFMPGISAIILACAAKKASSPTPSS